MTHIALPQAPSRGPIAAGLPAPLAAPASTPAASAPSGAPMGLLAAAAPALTPPARSATFQTLAALLVLMQDVALWPAAWAAGAAALGALNTAARPIGMQAASRAGLHWATEALRLLAGTMLGVASLLGSDWGTVVGLTALALTPTTPGLPAPMPAALVALPAALAAAAVPTPERAGIALLALLAALLGNTQAPVMTQAAPVGDAPPRPSLPDIQRILGRDQATGLPNRLGLAHLLADEAGRATVANTPLSVLTIRLDTPPTQPRLATRPVMASVADTLQSALMRPFDRLAWMGPGRFAAVLPFTDALGADLVARRMVAAMSPPAAEHSVARCPRATLSIGVATYGGRGAASDTLLLQQAEQAEAAAAASGGARVTRYDPMAATLRPPTYAERMAEAGGCPAEPAGGAAPRALAS